MSVFDLARQEQFSVQNPSLPAWAQMVEQGNPRSLGIIDPDLAYDLTEDDIITQIQEAESESERAREAFDAKWYAWEDLYRLHTSAGEKQDWQSDLIVPEVRHKIQTLRSLMQSALIDPERFFTIIKESELFPDAQIRFIESWMYLTLRNANFRQAMLDVLEEAFLFGTGWMRTSINSRVRNRPGIEQAPLYQDPQQEMAAQQAGMPTTRPIVTALPEVYSTIECRIRHVRSMFPDPLCRFDDENSRYVIERFETDREEIEELQRLGIYDSVADIGEGMRDNKDLQRSYRRIEQTRSGRQRHLIQEYTGNLYKDGKLACKNWVVTVANTNAILRIGPQPLWSGRSRYTCATPLARQDSPWGESIIEADAVVESEMKTLLDLMSDDVKYSVLGAFQIDEARSSEPEPITGIEPGRTYHGDGEFIRKLTFPSQANGAWPLLNHLQGIGDKSTMVNEFAAGTPSSRGRPTATEVQSKTQSATGHIHNIARGLEEDFIEPTLTLVYEYLLQFGSEVTPELEDVASSVGGGDLLRDPVTRFQLLDVPFRFQVRGISMLATRESLWQRVMQIMQLGQQMGVPPADPLKPFFTLISSMGFAPEQLGYTLGPEQYRQYQQAQAQQAQQNAGGGSGSGGRAATPPSPPGPANDGSPPAPDAAMNQARSQQPSQ